MTGQSLNALCDETCSLLSDIGISPPLEKPSFFEGSRGRFEPEPLANYWKAVKTINQVLTKIKNEMTGETSPVQLRPDDFALILTIFDKVIKDGNSSLTEQIELGFSTGDDRFAEAYFFISSFPEKHAQKIIITAKNSAPFTNDNSEMIFPYSELLRAKNSEEMLLKFYRGALK